MLYGDVGGLSPDEIEQLKSSPAWPTRLATAHTLPREARAEEGYYFDTPRFNDLHMPILLLLGGDSPSFLKAATEAIDKALSNSPVVVMPGQQHIAMYTAPDLFLKNVLAFLV